MDGLPIYWMDGLCHYPPNLSDRSMIRYHYLSMTLDGWMDHGRSILNKTTAIDGIHPSIHPIYMDGLPIYWMHGWMDDTLSLSTHPMHDTHWIDGWVYQRIEFSLNKALVMFKKQHP